MKKIITIAFLAVVTLCQGAEGYKITGKLDGKNDGKAYLMLREGREWVSKDSTDIKNGQFVFSGTPVEEPTLYYLQFSGLTARHPFFLENGNIKVSGDLSEKPGEAGRSAFAMQGGGSSLVFTGTSNNDAIAAYNEAKKPLDNERSELSRKMREARTNKDSITLNVLSEEYRNISKKLDNLRDAFIARYKNLTFASYLMEPVANGYSATARQIDSLLNILDPSLNSSYVREMKKKSKVLHALEPGKVAPEISLSDMNGKTVTLSSLKGQYVFIDFWASWCGPCRAEIPNLAKAYDKYKSKGFEIFGVSIDEKRDAWEKAVNDFKMNWIQVIDQGGWNSGVISNYAIVGIPTTMLLDKDGKIIARNLRGDKLEEKLKEIFGE